MRRQDREITDFDKMIQIVDKCDCCRIGLMDQDGVYIVPMNFGYEAKDGQLILYFHGAKEGHKMELLKEQKQVSFEMDTKHELVENSTACGYTYRYQCVMGNGEMEILQDNEEKIHGLRAVMEHYAPGKEWVFPDKMLQSTSVMKLAVTRWTGKES